MYCDAREQRATVYLDEEGLIRKVTKECRVGLPFEARHGAAFRRNAFDHLSNKINM